MFQRRRVDLLLEQLGRQFPPRLAAPAAPREEAREEAPSAAPSVKSERPEGTKREARQEGGGPPGKKIKTER